MSHEYSQTTKLADDNSFDGCLIFLYFYLDLRHKAYNSGFLNKEVNMTFNFANISLFDIILSVVIASSLTALIWELIPDGSKAFWKYLSDIRKDACRGERKKYSFSWRIGRK